MELLVVVWRLERFRFCLYGKQIQLFSDHQALEPLLKRNKTNKQYSARLTRWLDRLNHFDITFKHTDGKEIKFTDFVSRNPTKNPEPEENYEEEFVINAIGQLATVYARIGRIFNQSETENTDSETNMHETRTLIDTRRNRANKSHTDSKYHSIQPLEKEISVNHSRMNNNNDENQNERQFWNDRQIRYHWSADDDNMTIIKSRKKSPETTELVRRRTGLARPGAMRPQWNRAAKITCQGDRKKTKEGKQKELTSNWKENKSNHESAPDISETSATEYRKDRKPRTRTENTQEDVTIHEPGAYPAIPVQDYRDGSIALQDTTFTSLKSLSNILKCSTSEFSLAPNVLFFVLLLPICMF